MTFQQLNYLVEISKCGSINKAAKKLLLSQSAISVAVKELEDELNLRFFIRTNKGVTFTPEGKEFLSHAISLVESKNRLEMMYSNNRQKPASTYFSISTQRYPFVQDAFMKFTKRHGEETYRLKIRETGIEDVIEDVYERKSDIGIVSENSLTEKIIQKYLDKRELIFSPIFVAKPSVYLRKTHPLAKNKAVTEDDLKQYPYVTFEQNEGVAIDFSEECQFFLNSFPNRRIVINTRELAIYLIANSDAVTTGSGLLTEGITDKSVMALPITGQPDITIGCLLPANSPETPLAGEFLELLTESINASVKYTASLH